MLEVRALPPERASGRTGPVNLVGPRQTVEVAVIAPAKRVDVPRGGWVRRRRQSSKAPSQVGSWVSDGPGCLARRVVGDIACPSLPVEEPEGTLLQGIGVPAPCFRLRRPQQRQLATDVPEPRALLGCVGVRRVRPVGKREVRDLCGSRRGRIDEPADRQRHDVDGAPHRRRYGPGRLAAFGAEPCCAGPALSLIHI